MSDIKVKGEQGLVRDSRVGYIKNTDRDAYLNYMNRKKKATADKERIDSLEKKVAELLKKVNKLTKEK